MYGMMIKSLHVLNIMIILVQYVVFIVINYVYQIQLPNRLTLKCKIIQIQYIDYNPSLSLSHTSHSYLTPVKVASSSILLMFSHLDQLFSVYHAIL